MVNQIRKYLRDKNFSEAFELVDDKMIDAFAIAGNHDSCKKKIEELVDVGVDQIVLGTPIGPSITKIWKKEEIISKENAIRNVINKILSAYRIQ